MSKVKGINKIFLTFGFIILSSLTIRAQKKDNDDHRIVGGKPTTVAKEPYIVQVLFDDSFICGGSILSPRWIITAAHCVQGYAKQNERFKVRGGATFLTGTGGLTREVSKIVRPNSFNPNTYYNDIALMKLRAPMKGKNMKPIKLATKAVTKGALVRTTGWGYTAENGAGSNRLMTVQISRIAQADCRKRYAARGIKISNNMICASKPGKDSCSGDSGGPLTYNRQLVGVVSFGIGCARRQFPGVYTDILKLKGFIKRAQKM